jgi:glycosyltransferase involved in cell wall biosynthesis
LGAHLLSLTPSYRGAGINGYINELLQHLPAAAGAGLPIDLVAYLHDPAFVPPPGLSVVRSRWNTRGPAHRILWEQTQLALLSRQLHLLHGLAFVAPLAAACATVITVHDLSFLRFPSAFRRGNRLYLSVFTKVSARRAARVIAVSESTRRDVIALCGVPPARVVTVPNGVSPAFAPADPAAVAAFRQRAGLPDDFILFLGTLEPRKNLVRLIDAYAKLCRGGPADLPRLVIAGAKGWFYEQIFGRVAELGLADRVSFPGFVPAADLPWWYRAARLFVYPSLFEGFGLPVLEAMASGTPVITSTVSSLPEVAGQAAVLTPPDDTDALAAALREVLADRARQAQMAAAGLKQAQQFTWARTAAATVEVYRAVLAPCGQAAAPGGAR